MMGFFMGNMVISGEMVKNHLYLVTLTVQPTRTIKNLGLLRSCVCITIEAEWMRIDFLLLHYSTEARIVTAHHKHETSS